METRKQVRSSRRRSRWICRGHPGGAARRRGDRHRKKRRSAASVSTSAAFRRRCCVHTAELFTAAKEWRDDRPESRECGSRLGRTHGTEEDRRGDARRRRRNAASQQRRPHRRGRGLLRHAEGNRRDEEGRLEGVGFRRRRHRGDRLGAGGSACSRIRSRRRDDEHRGSLAGASPEVGCPSWAAASSAWSSLRFSRPSARR